MLQKFGNRIAISGADGKMGTEIIKNIIKEKKLFLKAAITRKKYLLEKDVSVLIESNIKTGIKLNNNIDNVINDFDILIDFSSPKNTINNLSLCYKYNKKMIIGTTGFNSVEKEKIKKASNKIGIVFSSNFSIGINLLIKLVEEAIKILDTSYDIEITDTHHRNKVDAPSGTALSIGQAIAKFKNINFNNHAIYNRYGLTKIRKTNDIGFSVIRAGEIFGEHSVMFINDKESIKIQHTAYNRMPFVHGVLLAAIWLKNKSNGLYEMTDILNSNF